MFYRNLDFNRKRYILSTIEEIQTIITCTGIRDLTNYLDDNSKVFKVKEGAYPKLKEEDLMFLHLGENVVVPIKDVIGIFDLQTTMYSSDTSAIFKNGRGRWVC